MGEGSDHYKAGGIDVLKVLEAKLTPDQFDGFLLGNIIKYSLRMNWKGDCHSDASKLAHYARLLKERWERINV